MACNPVKCAGMQMIVLTAVAAGAATLHYSSATKQRALMEDFLKASAGGSKATAPSNGAHAATTDPASAQGPGETPGGDEGAANSTQTPTDPALDSGPAILRGLESLITVEQAVEIYNLPYVDPQAPLVFFLDARERDEYEKGHILDAYHVTPQSFFNDTLPEEMDQWPRDSIIVVYCSGGDCDASHLVETRLRLEKQFTRVYVMGDGYPGWTRLNLPTDIGPRPSN